ncbi:adenylate isopentenyltransferase 5, chloroplastic-like [Gastrolobium bilobum]|uniref:adenylate isopentenyltransferase 5, chloroplastic-like n=1 Tax=Gastrolobium bilobum TaxID=150636 RepID=UPI002AB100A3|nr:adenylate isopentenyltransferase 5, chloroplastic-like [Gastrolobium bilobum]XP_061347879.1 adenylate isopentenyltransferase 5, chloroplastic-like [Gastrolobium bilobum]XP_061347880.1 adenylate isopentenyltransferase 5, chloroplastic-like [Gastrolobium bilobum]
MIIPVSSAPACKQVLPLINFQKGLTNMESLSLFHHRKDKVVVILGATGTGKTKLAIDLANHFPPAEIVNSDKMQVYKGLDITTNKVTEEETRGVPHHLLGMVDPNLNFTANDFCLHASLAIDSIVGRDGLPIIAGGSNSYIDALVNHNTEFRLRYECCFLWVDVSLPVLHSSLHARVDRMIEGGQLDEVREFFDPCADYTRGIRRAIGVPEFHDFLRAESTTEDYRIKKRLLESAIERIKVNNCTLANRQLQKIHRLHSMWKRSMHRLDATEVFLKSGSDEQAREAWEDHVLAKSLRIVHKFLYEESHVVPAGIVSPKDVITAVSAPPPPVAMAAVAAATH